MNPTITQLEEAIYTTHQIEIFLDRNVSVDDDLRLKYREAIATIYASLQNSLSAIRSRRVYVSDVPSERTHLSFTKFVRSIPNPMDDASSDDLIQRIEARLENLENLLTNLKHRQSDCAQEASVQVCDG